MRTVICDGCGIDDKLQAIVGNLESNKDLCGPCNATFMRAMNEYRQAERERKAEFVQQTLHNLRVA